MGKDERWPIRATALNRPFQALEIARIGGRGRQKAVRKARERGKRERKKKKLEHTPIQPTRKEMPSELLANQSEARPVECDRAEKKTSRGKGTRWTRVGEKGVCVGGGWAFTGQGRQELVGGVMGDDGWMMGDRPWLMGGVCSGKGMDCLLARRRVGKEKSKEERKKKNEKTKNDFRPLPTYVATRRRQEA